MKKVWYGVLIVVLFLGIGIADTAEAQTVVRSTTVRPVQQHTTVIVVGTGGYGYRGAYTGVNPYYHSRVPMRYGTGPGQCGHGHYPVHYGGGYVQGGVSPYGGHVQGAYYGNGYTIRQDATPLEGE